MELFTAPNASQISEKKLKTRHMTLVSLFLQYLYTFFSHFGIKDFTGVNGVRFLFGGDISAILGDQKRERCARVKLNPSSIY
jgi:hypothetical protein